MSPFWIILELRMMEMMVTAVDVQSSSQIVTTNKPTPAFFRPCALLVAQPAV